MKTIWSLILAAAAAAQVPVFQSEARIVEVPVLARDARNSPVADLKISDLHLLDNGVEQSIVSLERFGGPGPLRASGNPIPDSLGSRLGPRSSILLLDVLNTPLPDQIRGQNGISEMLRKVRQDQDKTAIYVLAEELRLLSNFTTDTEILRAVIDHYPTEQLPIGAVAPAPVTGRVSALGAPAPPRDPESIRLAEQRLEITLDAFSRIASRMKTLPGEKSLVWMTAGFPPPGDPQRFYAVIEQLRAAKVRLYPIDARGLLACIQLPCPPWVSLNIDLMEELAHQTGGRAYHDSNGLSASVRSALEDSRQGYLLTYAPNNYRRDGAAHKVELQTSRKGIELRYRSGYVADSAAGRLF